MINLFEDYSQGSWESPLLADCRWLCEYNSLSFR